jgi:MFS family permease
MQRFAWPLLAAAVVLAVAAILATESQLPAIVATHFGPGGRADGFIPHDRYVALIVGLAVGMPLALAAVTSFVPRYFPKLFKLDRCKRWADPKARSAILASTATFGALEGALVAAFVAGVHFALIASHEAMPPRLDKAFFLPVVIAFVVLTLVACFAHRAATRHA